MFMKMPTYKVVATSFQKHRLSRQRAVVPDGDLRFARVWPAISINYMCIST